MNLKRPWLWLNLLSLDAPIVAVLWQQLFTRALGIEVTIRSVVTLALAVWTIYAGDRILDGWNLSEHSLRHSFYRAHGSALGPVLIIMLAVVAWLSLTGIRALVFQNGILLLLLVGAYMAAVHATPRFLQRRWPKELAVAIIFALGTCIHVWTYEDWWQPRFLAPFLLFAGLCWINCAAITHWEKGRAPKDVHPSTLWIGRHLSAASAAIAILAFLFATLYPLHRCLPIHLAEGIGALAFIALDRVSANLSPETLRVAADAVLCSPALLLPFV